MKTDMWIVIKAKQWGGNNWSATSVRATKRRPATAPSELSFKIEVDIPNSFFTRPELVARIEVPESKVRPIVDAQTLAQVADQLQLQTGFRVTVTSGDVMTGTEAPR